MPTAEELLLAAMRDEPDLIESVDRGCSYMTYAGSRYYDPEPPEYCDNAAEPNEDFCSVHLDMSDDE